MPELSNGDLRLWYADRGDADGPPVVLVHGLFFSRRLYERLAARLPGHRLLLIDLRGHGRSSRPVDADAYTWPRLASDVVALLDHLDIDRAVVGGLSLGANVTLAVADEHANRMSGAIVEMPVLESGRPAAERSFRPMATALERGGGLLGPVARVTAPLRRSRVPEIAGIADLASLHPAAGAAMLRTLLEDDTAVLRGVDGLAAARVPTMVIAHRNDSLHPVADARYVADRVPGARLEVMSSILELRVRSGRYADLIDGFLTGLG